MTKSLLILATASMLSAAAYAEDASPLSFNIGAVSDYRYRGISQTRLKPALQGGADYAFSSGFYVGTWASTIKWIKDWEEAADVDAKGSVEWDIYGGYKGEIAKDFSYDVGVLTYYYPSNKLKDVPGFKNANTTEIYGALTYGPATLKYSHALTNLFGTADSKNSGYLDLSATFDLGSGFAVVPHVGYQKIRGGENGVNNDDFSYTDYSVTLTKDFGSGWSASLAAVGADTKSINGVKAYASPANGKDLGKFGVVVGVKKTF